MYLQLKALSHRLNKYTNADNEHANAAEKSNISIYLLQVDLYIPLCTGTHTTVVVEIWISKQIFTTTTVVCVTVYSAI